MRYLSRLTSSARGEAFNPLIWPFLLSTFVYGIGLTLVIPFTGGGGASSLYAAMANLGGAVTPIIWGAVALTVIVLGATFLLFNIPPFGKASGLVGFMLWLFGAFCYGLGGDWIVLFAIAVPNMWFWFWQYLSLSLYRREDALDKATMEDYDGGQYDDEEAPRHAKRAREQNRGIDIQ